jgi:hypothetical protein
MQRSNKLPLETVTHSACTYPHSLCNIYHTPIPHIPPRLLDPPVIDTRSATFSQYLPSQAPGPQWVEAVQSSLVPRAVASHTHTPLGCRSSRRHALSVADWTLSCIASCIKPAPTFPKPHQALYEGLGTMRSSLCSTDVPMRNLGEGMGFLEVQFPSQLPRG